MYKSSNFIIFSSFVLITIHSCLAGKAGVDIEKEASSIHDKRKIGQIVNDNTVKNIYGLVTKNIDTKNRADDKDLERAIYAVHESVTVKGKYCFKFIVDYDHFDENAYNTHMHYLNVLTFGSYIMHKNRASCLWSVDYFNQQLSAKYVKYLDKTSIGHNRREKLKDRFNTGLSEKYFTLFRSRFMHSHEDMPDVDHQYLLKTADAILKNDAWDYNKNKEHGFKIFKAYKNGKLIPMCLQKPKVTIDPSREKRPRQWENEKVCSDIGSEIGLGSVIPCFVEYGGYIYEPFVSGLGPSDQEQCKNVKAINEFVINCNEMLRICKEAECGKNEYTANYINRNKINNSTLEEESITLNVISNFLEKQKDYVLTNNLNQTDIDQINSINKYLLNNIDYLSLQKAIIFSFLIMHLDLHPSNVIISLNVDGKITVTIIDNEYSLHINEQNKGITKFRSNGLSWLIPTSLKFGKEIENLFSGRKAPVINKLKEKYLKGASEMQWESFVTRYLFMKNNVDTDAFVGSVFEKFFNKDEYKESKIGEEYTKLFNPKFSNEHPVCFLTQHCYFVEPKIRCCVQYRQPNGQLTAPEQITEDKLNEIKKNFLYPNNIIYKKD